MSQTRILGVLAERADVDLQPQVTQAELNLEVGRVDEAISQSPDERRANCELVEHRLLGYPIPDSLLRSRLAPSKIGSGTGLDFECAGLYLIERGRVGAIRPLMDRLRRTRDRPDSSPRERSMMNHAIRTLKGYRAYRAGSLQVARKHWEGYTRFGPEGAIWRGDLYRKLGRLKTAEGWYLAAWEHPVAHKRLGRLYEQMGRPAKAQAAYRRFLAAWAGADPELQGWAEDVRERLRALGPERAAE